MITSTALVLLMIPGVGYGIATSPTSKQSLRLLLLAGSSTQVLRVASLPFL